MTPRLAPVLILAASLALCWTLAGHVARAGSAGRVVAANVPSATATPAWDGVFALPVNPADGWLYSGGLHGTAEGRDDGLHAVDFWPAARPDCGSPVAEWVIAVAPGVIDATGDGWVSQDVGPGSGWLALYYHVGESGRIATGTTVATGDRIGHPACVGMAHGAAAHLHFVMSKDGAWVVPPPLGGWTFAAGAEMYTGWATGPGGERLCPSSQEWRWPGCKSALPGK